MSSPSVRQPRRELVAQLAVAVFLLAYLALGAYEGWFIRSSSADIPISDTWNFVPALASFARNGHVSWGGVFGFYGEGRPVLERIGLLLSAKFFSLNVQMVKLLAVPVGFIELACAVFAFRWALPRARLAVVLAVTLPVAVMILCLSNWQNLLDEWNLMNLAAVALTFLALLLAVQLGQSRRRGLLIGLVLVCAVASFTGESGTLSWIACGLVLWLTPAGSRLADRIVYSVVAVAFVAIYFIGAPSPGSGGDLHHVGRVLDFALICLGNGVVGGAVGGLSTPRLIGAIEAIVALALAVATLVVPSLRRDTAVRVGFGLMAFGVMGAVATGLSRVNIGLGAAISSRYVVLTAPVAIGVYLILVCAVARRADAGARTRPEPRTLLAAALPLALALCLLAVSFSANATEAKTSPYKKRYYVGLLEMTCNPGAFSNKDLSRFDHSGGLDHHDEVQLLGEIADLRQAHISVFVDHLCHTYDVLAREKSKKASV